MRTLHAQFVLALLAAAPCSALDIYGVPPIEKIPPKGITGIRWLPGTVHLDCARNESEAFQVVLRSKESLREVTVVPEDLRGPGGAVLPAKGMRIYKVEWVDINAPCEPEKPSTNPNLQP